MKKCPSSEEDNEFQNHQDGEEVDSSTATGETVKKRSSKCPDNLERSRWKQCVKQTCRLS